jgi:SpoVK/Ycf46/Vps4 family AAA+-type ATPase
MLNKRKEKNMNPTKISNYNKFLSTLDQKYISLNNPIEKLKINEDLNKNAHDDVKNIIDKLIENITNNYSLKYSSNNFTGENYNDNITILVNDPNYYKDFINKKYKYIDKNNTSPAKNVEQPVEIKETISIETISIETEINNISDILKLIETYKIDASIKYNINMKALHDIKEPLIELNNMIGMKDLKNNIVDQILYFTQELHKSTNLNGDFMHTVIYGPPGTGKTEIAKIIGKIYIKIGILNKGTFKKVTRSDLVAGYLGQTALKTRDVIKEALGGVLFIDEAYALGNTEKKDSFSKECIDTLCEALSDNKDNLMVIIAGYENELKDCFFNYNQGLDSRFTWRFKTDEYTGEDLHNIFLKKVNEIGWTVHEDSNITSDWFTKNKEYFRFYGRDIETVLAKTKIAHSRRVFCKSIDEKKKITLKDLEKGFEFYLKNDDVNSRKEAENLKKQIYSSLYS